MKSSVKPSNRISFFNRLPLFSLPAILFSGLVSLSVVFSSCGGEKPDTDNNTMGIEPSFKDRDREIRKMQNDTLDRTNRIDSVNAKP